MTSQAVDDHGSVRQVPTVGVFLSSTWIDLEPERNRVRAVLEGMRQTKFIGMECFGSRHENTRHASIDEVNRSQVYVGLIAGRYGSGITEEEYRRALELGLRCFIYRKEERAIPAEWRETDPALSARLAALVQEVTGRHTVSTFSSPEDLAAKVSVDLSNWLFDEYLATRLDSAATGRLPRTEAEQLLGAIVDVTRLDQALMGRLRDAGFVIAAGRHSMAIAGDVIGSILVTGDHSHIFIGDYERLRDAYIEPWSVFERVRLDRFVGREWVLAAIDEFLARHASGYFVLEAKAGLGKTALLAHLVHERAYLHHFVELAPGPGGIAAGLKNLAAQLIREWSLNPAGADDVIPGAATRPDYLGRLLSEAARRRDSLRPGQQIVAVVDALDEAGAAPAENVFGLPRVLPGGVYFILSCRPLEAPLTFDAPRRVLHLEAQDTHHLEDIGRYIERAAKWPRVARSLDEARISPHRFRDLLLQRCGGIWVYLHYVLTEIDRGERGPLDIEDLPTGLWQYYARFWHRWRTQHGADWEQLHLPLLAMLAAVEDLPLEFLGELAGFTDVSFARRLLRESWSPFVTTAGGKESSYRLYHSSLREFLSGRADVSELTTSERAFAGELAVATEQAHSRIANRYLDAWGGLAEGLPKLAERAAMDAHYGVRTVVTHLIGARRLDDLNRLLRLEHAVEKRPANTWYEARDREGDLAGYLADLALAHRAAATACEEQIGGGVEGSAGIPGHTEGNPTAGWIAVELRFALMSASIRSMGRNLPFPLLMALVEQGVWKHQKALVYARQLDRARDRSLALSALSAHFPEERSALLNEALEVARTCTPMDCAESMAAVAVHLSGERKDAVLAEAVSKWCVVPQGSFRDDDSERPRIIGLLAPQLAAPLLRTVLEQTCRRADLEARGKTLAALVPFLPDEWRIEALAAIGEPRVAAFAANTIEDHDWREAFAGLFPHLSEHVRREAWQRLAAVFDDVDESRPYTKVHRLELIARLWPSLPEAVCKDGLRRALVSGDPDLLKTMLLSVPAELKAEVARATFAAARRLPPGNRDALLLPALMAAARRFGVNPQRTWQRKLITALANRIRYDSDESRKAEIVAAALPHLRGPLRRADALLTALLAFRRIYRREAREKALSSMAESFPVPLLNMVVRLAEKSDIPAPAKILVLCARRVPEPGRTRILARAPQAIWQFNQRNRSDALLDLASHLTGDLKKEVLAEAVSIRPIDDAAQRVIDIRTALAGARRAYPYPQSMLKGLLPYLPDELHVEALEIAQTPTTIYFERVDRDENLKALLPHLSPDLTRRALAALDATSTQVAILAQRSRLDPAEKERLVREAYASIRRERLDEISDDLLALAPYLPADLSDELGRFVSTTFPNILESEHVGAQDPPRTLRLLPVLPEDARADVLSSFLAMAGDGAGWATDLQRLAPYIPHQLLPAAIAAARERLREADRARVLAVLAARLPEPDRGHLLREALAIAQRLHERPGKPEAKRQTLEFLVPFLTEYSPSDLLSAIDDVDDRIFVAQRLAREAPARAPAVAAALRRALPADEDWRLTELHRFSDAAPQDLYALWKSTSRALAASTRAEACAILLRVGPVIRALGGDEAVAETNRALHDVARWWP